MKAVRSSFSEYSMEVTQELQSTLNLVSLDDMMEHAIICYHRASEAFCGKIILAVVKWFKIREIYFPAARPLDIQLTAKGKYVEKTLYFSDDIVHILRNLQAKLGIQTLGEVMSYAIAFFQSILQIYKKTWLVVIIDQANGKIGLCRPAKFFSSIMPSAK